MYEYKIETYHVNEAQAEMNKLAKAGWRVIAVCSNGSASYNVIVTYEKAVTVKQ